MPSALMSKTTSISTSPRRAGRMPSSTNSPSSSFSTALSLAPCSTAMRTEVWSSCDGGEEVALAGGDGGVAGDDGLEVAAHHQDAQVLRRHVEEQHLRPARLRRARQRFGLDGGAERHHLVRVDVLARARGRRAAGPPAARAACGVWPPTRMHLVHLLRADPHVAQRALRDGDAPLHQVAGDGPPARRGRCCPLEVERRPAVAAPGQEREVDAGGGGAGELALGLLGRVAQPLQGHGVVAQVEAAVRGGEDLGQTPPPGGRSPRRPGTCRRPRPPRRRRSCRCRAPRRRRCRRRGRTPPPSSRSPCRSRRPGRRWWAR